MALSYNLSTGSSGLRKEVVDGTIRNFTEQMFVMKSVLRVERTNAWKNTYMQENPAVLSANGQTSLKGVAPGADFPEIKPSFAERTSRILKFAGETTILWEDILAGDVEALQSRHLFKLSEAIVNSVDSYIWDELTESRSVSQIQSITITPGTEWNTTSAVIFNNLAHAERLLKTSNYWKGNPVVIVSPRDAQSIKNYIATNGQDWPQPAGEMLKNGNLGTVNGFDFKVSNNVTASYALVTLPGKNVYKELVPLATQTTEDPFKYVRIRAVEEGVVQLTDPLACVLVIGTQDTNA